MSQSFLSARAAVFLLGAAVMMSAAAADEGNSLSLPALHGAPCDLNRVVSEAQRRAADETARLAAGKDKDLDSAEQRAHRSDERIKKGDNFS